MSPEIIGAKLLLLEQVLLDLKPHTRATRQKQMQAHYEIERQVQLAVDLCIAIGRRYLTILGHPVPQTSREVFLDLAKAKLISAPLSKRLANAAGMRNLLVHEYADVDYELFFGGLKEGYKALSEFALQIQKKLFRKSLR